jgi:hypothetical protein
LVHDPLTSIMMYVHAQELVFTKMLDKKEGEGEGEEKGRKEKERKKEREKKERGKKKEKGKR